MARQKHWLLVAVLVSLAMFAGFLLSTGPNQVLALTSSTTAPLSYGFATQGLPLMRAGSPEAPRSTSSSGTMSRSQAMLTGMDSPIS